MTSHEESVQQDNRKGCGGCLGWLASGIGVFASGIAIFIFITGYEDFPGFLSSLRGRDHSSPEHSLRLYTQYLTNRNFSGLAEIYPNVNQAYQKQWLQGTDGKAPILTVQIVGQPQRISPSADGTEVVLRATLKYCRKDGSGSTDIKNYIFIQNQALWQLNDMTAPEEVKPIRSGC